MESSYNIEDPFLSPSPFGGRSEGKKTLAGPFGGLGSLRTSPNTKWLNSLKETCSSEAWSCYLCTKMFASRYYYERHMKCHQDLKEQCPYCPFRSTYKWNLKSHIRNKHKSKETEETEQSSSIPLNATLDRNVSPRSYKEKNDHGILHVIGSLLGQSSSTGSPYQE